MPRSNLSLRNARNAKTGLQALCNHIIHDYGHNDVVMLEIGAFSGDSAQIFSSNFLQVWSVDPWESGYDPNDAASNPDLYDMAMVEAQFDKVAEQAGNVMKMKMTSTEAINEFPDASLDFVYIDGLHTYEGVLKDIVLWRPKVKPNCFLGGHDYNSRHHPGVRKAVDEMFGNPRVATFPDSSWIVRV